MDLAEVYATPERQRTDASDAVAATSGMNAATIEMSASSSGLDPMISGRNDAHLENLATSTGTEADSTRAETAPRDTNAAPDPLDWGFDVENLLTQCKSLAGKIILGMVRRGLKAIPNTCTSPSCLSIIHTIENHAVENSTLPPPLPDVHLFSVSELRELLTVSKEESGLVSQVLRRSAVFDTVRVFLNTTDTPLRDLGRRIAPGVTNADSTLSVEETLASATLEARVLDSGASVH